jgi:hypothetical protein
VNANDDETLSLSHRPLLRADQVDMVLSDEAGVGKPAEEGLKGDEEEEEVQHVLVVLVAGRVHKHAVIRCPFRPTFNEQPFLYKSFILQLFSFHDLDL